MQKKEMKNPPISLDDLKGSLVLLYGRPFTGKSSIMAWLAGEIAKRTKKPAAYFAIDPNIKDKQLEAMSQFLNDKPTILYSPWDLRNKVKDLNSASVIVIDSITAIRDIFIMWGDEELEARNKARQLLTQVLLLIQQKLRQKKASYAFAIAHTTALFQNDYKGEKEDATLASTLQRHVDYKIKHELIPDPNQKGKYSYQWRIRDCRRPLDFDKILDKPFNPLDLIIG